MNNSQFDYIIIGAGAAGCVLANRLSANPANQVLLLEAGPAGRTPLVSVPIGFGLLYHHKTYNWRWKSQPEAGLNGRAIDQPLGKLLGGTTAINGMMYIRGQKEDYDHWAALGNQGWSYADVLPYFLRSEHYEGEPGPYHSKVGEWNVERVRYESPLVDSFIEAVAAYGLPFNHDPNGASQVGVGLAQVSQRRGRRETTARAFLSSAVRKRPNLRIETGAFAERLLLEGRIAVGVAYSQQGQHRQARARREVILCGGTLHNPQLLQLSGIGPAALLSQLGIPVLHDLPGVGENLQEHLGVDVMHLCKEPVSLADQFKPLHFMGQLFRYLSKGRGLLAFNGSPVACFAHTSGDHNQRPDCQVVFFPVATSHADNDDSTAINMASGMTAMIYPMRPDARGTVRVCSTDPQQPPQIQHNFLQTERDQRDIVNAVKRMREIFAQAPFGRYRGEEITPGAAVQSDAGILEYARQVSRGVYHPVGTCKMGSDAMAVVDSELKVHGIGRLRIVDASIMPTITSGNTCAPTVMIAEKAAAMILA